MRGLQRANSTQSDDTMLHRLRGLHHQTVAIGSRLPADSRQATLGDAEILSWAITKIEGTH